MIKKKIAELILIIIMIFVCCVGCGADGTDLTYEDDYVSVYNISRTVNDEQYVQYQYFIFDSERSEVIDYGVTYNQEPKVYSVEENIIKMSVSCGTDVEQVTYYDISDKYVSEIYENVLLEYNSNVVYIDFIDGSCNAVVKNMFTDDIILNVTLDLDGADVATAGSFSAEVNDDYSQLLITHPAGDDYGEVTETFDITNR